MTMDIKAMQKWSKIPKHIQKKLLDNVLVPHVGGLLLLIIPCTMIRQEFCWNRDCIFFCNQKRTYSCVRF